MDLQIWVAKGVAVFSRRESAARIGGLQQEFTASAVEPAQSAREIASRGMAI
jgi:hypothetical protein